MLLTVLCSDKAAGNLCRWDITRVRSLNTCVFKPTAIDQSDSRENLKRNVLGAVFAGEYQKVPRANKKCALVWEARLLVL